MRARRAAFVLVCLRVTVTIFIGLVPRLFILHTHVAALLGSITLTFAVGFVPVVFIIERVMIPGAAFFLGVATVRQQEGLTLF